MNNKSVLSVILIGFVLLSGCAHIQQSQQTESDMLMQIAMARGWSLTPTHEQVFIEGVRVGKSLGQSQCDTRAAIADPAVIIPLTDTHQQAQEVKANVAAHSAPKQAAPQVQSPPPATSAPATSEQNDEHLTKALAAISGSQKSRQDTDISQPQKAQASSKTNVSRGMLKDLFPDAVFNGKTADIILEREIEFDNLADLAASLQAELGVFVDMTPTGLIFSDLREITYETGFVTDEIALEIKNILTHPDSKASVNKAAKTITLIDNVKGHGNITTEITSRQGKYRQYRYRIDLQESGKSISQAAGAVSAAIPVQFAPDGGISLSLSGDKALVTAVYPKYPDRLQGIIETKGGVLESSRDSLKLTITLTR